MSVVVDTETVLESSRDEILIIIIIAAFIGCKCPGLSAEYISGVLNNLAK